MINGQGPGVIAIAATFMVLNSFFIAVRCYTKATISKTFNYNDIGMITVLATYASLMALVILGVENGIGEHTATATLHKLGESLKYIWFLEVIYVLLTSIMKASIATTLLQWAKSKVHIYLLWAAIAIDFVIAMVVSLGIVFRCSPISYAWTFVNPADHGTCGPFVQQLYLGYALCIVTISLDMLFLFVPFFMLNGRGVNSRLKVYIYGIFGLGVLASIANFIRLAALVKLKASNDQLFDAAPVFTWSVVEVSIGICVAGILECGPLMRKYNVKGFESYMIHFDRFDDDAEPLKLQLQKRPIDRAQIRRVSADPEQWRRNNFI